MNKIIVIKTIGRLIDTVVENVNLKDIKIEEVDFNGSVFINTNVRGAKFKRCLFEGVDLRGMIYDQKTDFSTSYFDIYTLFPRDFNPEENGMILVNSMKGIKND